MSTETEGMIYSFFFFSSRRRHTRWTGDWSSDVCSSDLANERTLLVFYNMLLYEYDEYRPIYLLMHHVVRWAREHGFDYRSEERRVGKSVVYGGGGTIDRKKEFSSVSKAGVNFYGCT